MRLVICTAVPADHPSPVRIEEELTRILREAYGARKEIRIDAAFPGSLQALRRETASFLGGEILHISAHGVSGDLELEDERGRCRLCSGADVASALAFFRGGLIVLSGCGTEALASRIHAAIPADCQPWIISTTGDVLDEPLNSFMGAFYGQLFRTANVAASFEAAAVGGTRNLWFLHRGTSQLTQTEGVAEIHWSISNLLNWVAITRSLIPRVSELGLVYDFLCHASPSCWITGPPRSGVSTMLRAAAARFGWMFERPPVQVDLSEMTFPQFERIFRRVATLEAGRPFSEILQTESRLICLDSIDRADPGLTRELLAVMQMLRRDCRSRILLGTLLEGGLPDLGSAPIVLGELTISEAQAYTSDLPVAQAARLQTVLPDLNRLPGRLVDVVNDVRNGVAVGEILRRQREGDLRSGLERQVKRTVRNDAAAKVFQVLCFLGPVAPREIASDVFIASFPDAAGTEIFERGVRLLRDAQLLRVENIQRGARSMPEAWFRYSSDTAVSLRNEFRSMGPSLEVKIVGNAMRAAVVRARAGSVGPEHDAPWLAQLAKQATRLQLRGEVLELGQILFAKRGAFRFFLHPEIEGLAASVLSAAQALGKSDEIGYFGLMLGEVFYASGRLEEAERTFRSCLSAEVPAGRRLQLCRALGQISYRVGDYSRALEYYEQALRYEGSADADIVATVKHHQSKALFRVGRGDLALRGFTEVVSLREASGNVRGLLQSQHERARVLQSQGRLDEAERIYHLVVAGALAEHYDALLPAPHYQLALLELERGRIDAAEDCARRCHDWARPRNDAFWEVHGLLLTAMISHERGDIDASTSALRECVSLAMQRGFGQVVEDARRWILNRLMKAEDDGAATVVAIAYSGLDESKALKAARYAREPHRVASLEVVLRTDSGVRRPTWRASEGWRCSCEYWRNHNICSHIAALHLLSGPLLGILLAPHKRGATITEAEGDVPLGGSPATGGSKPIDEEMAT